MSRPASILIVDDHELVRKGLRQFLLETFPQAQLGEADSLVQARALLRGQTWDLVLLDINLPDGSGLDLIPEARAQAGVLVLSSYPEVEYAARAFRLGASGYLTKRSVGDEMVMAVSKILAGGKYVTSSLAELLATELGNLALPAPHEALSPREMEVLLLVVSGRTIKEIAAGFGLSEKTIATYRARIAEKLQLSSSVELTRYAFQHKLVN